MDNHPTGDSPRAVCLRTWSLWLQVGFGRGIRTWQAVLYSAGWLSLAAALCTPLHWLGEHVFTFHMIEHEIIMAVAAPLIAVARPLGAYVWAFPRAARRRFHHLTGYRPFKKGWSWVASAEAATLIPWTCNLGLARTARVRRRDQDGMGSPPAAPQFSRQCPAVLVGAMSHEKIWRRRGTSFPYDDPYRWPWRIRLLSRPECSTDRKPPMRSTGD